MEPDIPLLVPEVNPGHLELVHAQQRNRGWKGMIVTNPNCSTIVLTLALAPLVKFGIERLIAATMQAVSGAGYPGVASMDIVGNVVPFIGSEEEKMQQETQKILGDFTGDSIQPLAAKVSAHCNRVPVVDGHMVATSVEFERKPSLSELIAAIENFRSVPGIIGFATALKLCEDELPIEMKRLTDLRNILAAALFEQLDNVQLCGPELNSKYDDGTLMRLPGNLNLSFGNVDGEALLLAMGNLAVSSGAACTATDSEPSHVLRALGFSDDAARSSLRFGLGRFNDDSDVEFAIGRVVEAVRRLRKLTNWPTSTT
jgi:hypothetical protein